jgi:DNA mismatch repair protein MutS
MAGFPHHALDTYLPKLIRAGERVAICDQLEDPRKAKQSNEESQQVTRQEVKEIVSPGKKQEEEQHRSIHR